MAAVSRRFRTIVHHVRMASASSEALHYDIITIGSGGGAKVSTPAANLGFKVAMIEHGFDVFGTHKAGLGGTCLNRGCIPSKMLIHPADVMVELNEAGRFGIKATAEGVDFEGLVTRVSEAIDKDSNSILPGYEGHPNKHLYQESAKFIGHKTLQVGDKVLTADYIFLAAGAEPAVPPIPGLAGTPFLTSTEALRLTKLPKKMIVIGAGYIACELGHMYGALGTEVHMMARSELLRAMDGEAKHEFARVFSERYACHIGVDMQRVEYSEADGFTLHYLDQDKQPQSLNADQLLVSTGVTPVGDKLDLDKTGVALRKGGFVQVDGCLKTTCPGIWCFGDLAGNYLFRHCANFEGEYLLENVIHPIAALRGGGNVSPDATRLDYPPIDYTGMPWAVFSNPQVAGVGMSEEEVQAAGIKYVKGVNLYSKSAMGDARLSDHGFVKVLVEVGTRRILGSVMVGYEASTMIHAVIPLMRLGGKLDDLLYMIYIHPALPEILRNACRKARDALVAAGDDVPLKLRLK